MKRFLKKFENDQGQQIQVSENSKDHDDSKSTQPVPMNYGPFTFFSDSKGRSENSTKSFFGVDTEKRYSLVFSENKITRAWVKVNGHTALALFSLFGKEFRFERKIEVEKVNHIEADVDGPKGASVTVRLELADIAIPQSPNTKAPTSYRSLSSVSSATSFLYTGANPIQTGVAAGTITPVRAAVIRGKVLDDTSNPLSGVQVTILNHPEYGQTLSRADGAFDLAVNGGAALIVVYQKGGYFTVQRRVDVKWQKFSAAPDVVMTQADAAVTLITTGARSPAQLAIADSVTDSSGTRQAAIYFPPGTTAMMSMPNGTTQSLSSMSVRATEYSVGANAQSKLPALLPAKIPLTYAVELSADEAISSGATHVSFNQPVYQYVNNFKNFPVGMVIPTKTLNTGTGNLDSSASGRVIRLLSVSQGLANLDVDGQGSAATSAELEALGITSSERQELALLYASGQSFWRTPAVHFSTYYSWEPDQFWSYINYENGFLPGNITYAWASVFPGTGCEGGYSPNDQYTACEIYCDQINSAGQGWSCSCSIGPCEDTYYAQYFWPGVECTLVSLTDNGTTNVSPFGAARADCAQPPTPTTPNQNNPSQNSCATGSIIDVESQNLRERVPITGTPFSLNYSSSLVPGRSDRYSVEVPNSWFQDASPGVSPFVTISVAGETNVYYQPSNIAEGSSSAFVWDGKDVYGRTVTRAQLATINYGFNETYEYVDPSTGQNTGVQESTQNLYSYTMFLGGPDARFTGLGGWLLDAQKVYDPTSQTLYNGDGTQVSTQPLQRNITVFAGGGSNSADQIPATQAEISDATALATAGDGSVYFVDNGSGVAGTRIRLVNPEGIISTVAGGGSSGLTDGMPATNAQFENVTSIAVGPDGSVYGTDSGLGEVFSVDPSGTLHLLAGGGAATDFSNPIPANQANLSGIGSISVTSDNTVLFSFQSGSGGIAVLTTDGNIGLIPGSGSTTYAGAAVEPDESALFASTASGIQYFSSQGNWTTVSPQGIAPIAGPTLDRSGNVFYTAGSSTGGNALYEILKGTQASKFIQPLPGTGTGEIAVGQDGTVYYSKGDEVLDLSFPFPQFPISDFVIASQDGAEVYAFDPNGNQLATMDAVTGATLYTFNYDPSSGFLTSIADRSGNLTTIQRDSNGNPLSITSPYGVKTTLTLNSDGFLASISDPANDTYTLTYQPGNGLLETFTRPSQNSSSFTYDTLGRLASDLDAAGGDQIFSRTDGGQNNVTVVQKSASGPETIRNFGSTPNGGEQMNPVFPDGTTSSLTTVPNQSSQFTDTDGTQTQEYLSPDPRFQYQSPYVAQSTVTTPSGLQADMTVSRSIAGDVGAGNFQYTEYSTLGLGTITDVFDSATTTRTVTTGLGRSKTTTYDPLGRPSVTQVPGLSPASYSYDGNGRLSSISQGNRTASISYNAQGYVSSYENAAQETTTYGYDSAGRVTTETLPDQRVIGFSYDADGNLTSVAPPGKPASTMGYNAIDLLENFISPTVGGVTPITQYSYNPDRKISSITRPDGALIQLNYNRTTGQLATMTTPQGSYQYSYDASTGQLSAVSSPTELQGSPSEETALQFDGPLNSLITWTGPYNGGVQTLYDNIFDYTFQLLSPDANIADAFIEAAYWHDNDGLLIQSDNITYQRDPGNGLITGSTTGTYTAQPSATNFQYVAYGVVIQDDYTRNAFGEVTGYQSQVQNGSATFFQEQLTRDNLGRVSASQQTADGATINWGYIYDTAGRLSSVTQNGSPYAQYTYDPNSNRLTRTTPQGTVTGTYDAQDRVLTYGTLSYTYTQNGEVSTVSDSSSGKKTRYSYDSLGDLYQVQLPNGNVINYDVDGLGRRIGRYSNRGVLPGTLRFLTHPDGIVIAAAFQGAPSNPGQIFFEFVYGTSATVPDGFQRYSTYDAEGQTSPLYKIVRDERGSVRQVIDPYGTVVQEMDYDDFGNVIKDTNPGFQPFGFAGGIYDPDTGITHFGARDYDPEVGRWLQRDPIGFDGGDVNLYGYVLNDPINATDSTGLASDCTRPLSFLPGEAGYVSHEFVCYTGSDGKQHCGGLGPKNGFMGSLGGPGVIEPDSPNSSCQDKGKGCMDKCVGQALNSPAPNYNLFGSNCHDFARSVISQCQAKCGGQ